MPSQGSPGNAGGAAGVIYKQLGFKIGVCWFLAVLQESRSARDIGDYQTCMPGPGNR